MNVRVPISNSATRFKAALFYSSPVGNAILVVLVIFHAPAALAAQVHPGHVVNLRSRGFTCLPPCRTRESFRGLVILHAPAALAAQKYTPAARATQNVTGNQTGYSTTRRRGATRPSASISAMPMNLRSSPSVTRTRPSDGTPAACTG